MKFLLLLILTSSLSAQQLVVKQDIIYKESSRNKSHKLDIYRPLNVKNEKLPLLIFIHGGGWRIGDKRNGKGHGYFYARKGIITVSINYRLTPEVKHPGHINDCIDAVGWVFKNLKNLNADKARVYISGHSAGAHLAALTATNSQLLEKYKLKPDSFAAVFPVDTASWDLTKSGRGLLSEGLTKKAIGTDFKTLKDASPCHHIKSGVKYAPFHIFGAQKRAPVIEQAGAFVKKLNESGGKAILYKIKGHDHAQMNKGMHEEGNPISTQILKVIKGTDK